jgi:hypothetical protein
VTLHPIIVMLSDVETSLTILSRESAILIIRPAGNTTAVVRGKNGATGVALVKVYTIP